MTSKNFARLGATLASGAAIALLFGAGAVPAAADSLPAPGCYTDCVATFDTVGAEFEFEIPATITELTLTLAGGAGAPPSVAITGDPTAVGGPGGATTIDLGTGLAGETLYLRIGGVGGATSVQRTSSLVAVTGGGGQGGYVGDLDVVGQISGTFPGGAGASPTVAGYTAGGDATAWSSNAANGLGGTGGGGGDGGTGDANGGSGGDDSQVGPTIFIPAAGGGGGSIEIAEVIHVGGRGGEGVTGGGGGGIALGLDGGDDILVDLVAPGGGGSGYLADAYSGTAAEPNTGTGFVTFTYSLPAPAPTAPPALPATGSEVGGPAIWTALGLLALGGVAVVALGRRRSA